MTCLASNCQAISWIIAMIDSDINGLSVIAAYSLEEVGRGAGAAKGCSGRCLNPDLHVSPKPEESGDPAHIAQIGRTSTAPRAAPGQRAAQLIAASRSGASIR